MPRKELPFGYEVEHRDLGSHMPRKEVVREREVIHNMKERCAYTVEFTRDEYGRIKSPITIRPKTT
jgi:hypothetical protein